MTPEWQTCSLADLIEIRHGFAFSGTYIDEGPAGDILLTPGNFAVGGGFKGDRFKYYSGPVPQDFVLEEGDLLVTMTDLSKQTDTLGYPAFVPAPKMGRKYLHNQRLGKVVVRPEAPVDLRYLYYVLCSAPYRHEILAGATGTTVKHTSPKRIGQYRFPVPPISEQRAISTVLGSLDDKIELNRRMSETLEEMSATYFKAWLQEAGIGQGTPEGTLADIIEFDPAERLRKGAEAPYLGLAHIPNSGMIHEAPDARPHTSGSRFRDGDTLFARITPSLENGKTAIALGLGSSTVAWGSTELIVMRPKQPVPVLVPYLISRDPAFRAHAVQNMSGTSGRQRVPREALMRYPFPTASRQEWQHLNRLMAPVVEAVWIRAQESRTLAELRDALLPKLISGELRIPEAEQLVSEVA